MRKFKIKNRPKRKYTKRNSQSVPLNPNPYMPIKTFAPAIPTITPNPSSPKEGNIFHFPLSAKGARGIYINKNIKTKNLLIYITLLIIALSSIILKPYLPFEIAIFTYQNLLFQIDALSKIILTIQNLTNENYKIICKIMLTIIYTIDFTNKWLISQTILLLSATGQTITNYWEELTNIISTNLTQAGQELKPLSPPLKFVLNDLHDSAQALFGNMQNIFKSISEKNITVAN